VTIDSSGKAILYINGVQESSPTNTRSGQSVSTGNDQIGVVWYGGSRSAYFNGSIDEVRISNIARTPAQIQSSYLDGISKFSGTYTSSILDLGSSVSDMTMSWTPSGVNTGNGETPYSTTNMVAQWNFNETSGTTAVSGGTCGTSCNGTLTNMTTTGQDAGVLTGWTSNNRRWGSGALMFDGTNDYVNAGTNAAFNITGNLTIETWFKPLASGAAD